MVFLVRARADPQEMRRRVIPVARQAVRTGHGLFVVQEQGLVRGVKLGPADGWNGFRCNAAGFHEAQCIADAVGQPLIAFAQRAPLDEAEIPAVNAVQVGVTALCKSTQQVQRRRGLVIGFQQTLRVGLARFGREFQRIDVIAAIAGQSNSVFCFCIARARLGELPRDAAHFHNWQRTGIGQHDGHLQDNAERIADFVGVEFGKALGAVAPLEEERLTGGNLG